MALANSLHICNILGFRVNIVCLTINIDFQPLLFLMSFSASVILRPVVMCDMRATEDNDDKCRENDRKSSYSGVLSTLYALVLLCSVVLCNKNDEIRGIFMESLWNLYGILGVFRGC